MARRHAGRLSVVVLLATAALGLASASASASTGQEAWLQDDGALKYDPSGTMQQLRLLGVDRARVAVHWLFIAPRPNSHTRPRFDAANPAAYPAGSWRSLDRIVKAAEASLAPGDYDGLRLAGADLSAGIRVTAGQVEPVLVTVLGGVPQAAFAGNQDYNVGLLGLQGALKSLPDFALLDQDGDTVLALETADWFAPFDSVALVSAITSSDVPIARVMGSPSASTSAGTIPTR